MILFDLSKGCFDNLIHYWQILSHPTSSETRQTSEYTSIDTGSENPLFNPIFLSKTAKDLPQRASVTRHSFWHDSQQNKELPARLSICNVAGNADGISSRSVFGF